MNLPDHEDDRLPTPSAEALVAGTMALMTGYAQAPEQCPHRPLMAKKIVSNLFFLATHPALSEPLRATMGHLGTRWQLEHGSADSHGQGANAPAFQHPAPGALQ